MFLKSKRLLIILGSTSTGKTDLALKLAKKFNGEIVSCDSRQVYKKLDIGTGKLPGKAVVVKKGKGFWEMCGIKVWMYDVVDNKKQYSVADYVKDANKVINDIFKRGKLPIIVGGTGFYLKALLEGLPNLAIPVDQRLRKQLEKISRYQLQKKLQKVSLQKWEQMNNSDRQNPRRLVRAIEIALVPHTREILRFAQNDKGWVQNDILKIGLTASRGILYQRIDERVIDRINQGMIEEAEKLHKTGLSLRRMKQLGLEYGVLADYMEGKFKNREEFIKIMQRKIHGFVRRQQTWFKNPSTSSGNIFWFNIEDKQFPDNVEKQVAKWYHQADDT